MTPTPDRGFTLAEVVVATVLTGLLLLAGTELVVRLQRVARSTVDTGEWIDATRLGTARVDRAVRSGSAELDAGGELRHRAFRGSAVWCGDGWMERAVRFPDPARDSVWWVDAHGAARVLRLSGRTPGGCGGAGSRLHARVPGDSLRTVALEGGVLRWFERGRLGVDDAVRYGRDGRPAQPLTPAVLGGGSGFRETAESGVELLLHPAGESAPAGPWVLRWRPG